MSLNQRIKEARLKMGFTQEQLGSCIGVAKTTVAGYEKNREPDAATIGLIMDALKVDANYLFQDEMKELSTDDFSIPEIKMVKKYRDLDDFGKEVVDSVIDIEQKRMKSKMAQSESEVIIYSFPYASDLVASAGIGEYAMDVANFENIGLTEKPPREANFLIRISGDSMEPKFSDDDKVFIKRIDAVEIGEIGLFYLDGNVYIKKLGEGSLISLNSDPKYKPVPIKDFSSFKCFGKVLGKCKCKVIEL